MDAFSLLRTLGALAMVLGMLAGALWVVRRYNIRLPGGSGAGGPTRRLEVVERAALDGRRSVALLRRDGREHLILLAPEGNVMLETAIVRDEIDHAAEAARLEAEREAAATAKAEAEAMRESFFAMVDKARDGVKGKVASVTSAAALIKAAPEADAKVKAEPEAKAEPEPKAETEAKTEAEATAEPQAKVEPEAEARAEAQAEASDEKPEPVVKEVSATSPSTVAEAPLPAPAPARKRTRTSTAQPKRTQSTAAKRRASGAAARD